MCECLAWLKISSQVSFCLLENVVYIKIINSQYFFCMNSGWRWSKECSLPCVHKTIFWINSMSEGGPRLFKLGYRKQAFYIKSPPIISMDFPYIHNHYHCVYAKRTNQNINIWSHFGWRCYLIISISMSCREMGDASPHTLIGLHTACRGRQVKLVFI